MSKPKSGSNKTLIIGLSIIIIIAVAFGLYLYSTNLSLASDLNTLRGQYTSLTNQYNDLSSQHNTLTNQYNALSSQYNTVFNTLTALNTEYNSLRSDYISLNSTYTSLSANYSQLLADYQDLLGRVPADKGITINWVNYTHLQVYGITVRNLGVNSVNVYAIKMWWNTNGLLSDSISLDLEIPGNSSVYIDRLLTVNSWNFDWETWTVVVYTTEGYNATSDPLPLGQW